MADEKHESTEQSEAMQADPKSSPAETSPYADADERDVKVT